jgi:two-component system phosphate regulon sensor histidine kinase PhoR
MHSSRLFWKLLAACVGLSLVAVVAFGLVLSGRLQDQIVEQVDRRLRDSAYLLRGELADQLQSGASEALQQRLRELGKETDTRFTLIAADGAVLADSERDTLAEVQGMDNHRDRPEIVQARTHGEGRSTRPSATLRAPHHYFAVRIDVGGKRVGYIRSALPAAEISAQTAAARRWTWGLAAVVFLGLLAAAYWIVGQILRPVKSLTEAADAIASGNYQHRLYIANRDELGALAQTFNRMSQDLHARMTQLQQTGDRQSTVLGGMIEGVIAVDARERIVLANSAAGRLLEFRPPAAEGRPLLEIVRNHAIHAAVLTALQTSQPQRLETKSSIQHPASTIQRIDIHVQPLPGDPCPGAVLVMHDTTELRRLESLRRDFIANVSHELKTPLSSIKAYTETLRNGALRDPTNSKKFLERIEEQADRLHHLIMDMLMLARIESDQQPFEIVPVDVAAVIAACLDDHRPAADAKRISLTIEADPAACRVRADREGLREILDNLVDNAIKYTPDGGQVTVSWRCDQVTSEERGARSEERGARTSEIQDPTSSIQHPASSNHPAVFIAVRDTGIGIRAKDLSRVFERFYRVDKARSRELGGTGLGLAIVKHLVQSFGGKISVESEPGKGSTFTVELQTA